MSVSGQLARSVTPRDLKLFLTCFFRSLPSPPRLFYPCFVFSLLSLCIPPVVCTLYRQPLRGIRVDHGGAERETQVSREQVRSCGTLVCFFMMRNSPHACCGTIMRNNSVMRNNSMMRNNSVMRTCYINYVVRFVPILPIICFFQSP